MGGLWVDYQLQSTIDGLFVIGEANFSDHGANRLGASALMQGLADGYFILPYTIGNYLAQVGFDRQSTDNAVFQQTEKEVSSRVNDLLKNRDRKNSSTRPVDYYHRKLGAVVWDYCGMSRDKAGLTRALGKIPEIREEFYANVYIPGNGQELNQSLERAGRVADFLEFAETMVLDALEREESCGCHLREESQTEEHEAKRDDAQYSHVAVWEYRGKGERPALHKESLQFEDVTPSQRSYK
jgi:succinate dehydrogenase / fumarate reductase flavoprotein subunit